MQKSLYDLQHCFISSMLSKTFPNAAFKPTSDTSERLEMYRYNFMAGYLGILMQIFPITANYMGGMFSPIAVSYILTLPQEDPLLSHYGRTFPSYLRDPIAAELAKLEWLLHTAVLMPSDDAIVNTSLTNLHRTHWQLRSDVILLDSLYPIEQLYREIKLNLTRTLIQPQRSYYVIYRLVNIPTILHISPNDYQVLTCLRSPTSTDELFDKLTFPKAFWVNFLDKMFNSTFLKVANVNESSHSTMYSDL